MKLGDNITEEDSNADQYGIIHRINPDGSIREAVATYRSTPPKLYDTDVVDLGDEFYSVDVENLDQIDLVVSECETACLRLTAEQAEQLIAHLQEAVKAAKICGEVRSVSV